MSWRQMIELQELLDDPAVTGEAAAAYLEREGVPDLAVTRVEGEKGEADFIRAVIPGTDGRLSGGNAPTLGIVGRLGGIGARPARIGFTSDGDGALSALTIAAKLGQMHTRGDRLKGDVIVTTQICPNAPTRPHDPVPSWIRP